MKAERHRFDDIFQGDDPLASSYVNILTNGDPFMYAHLRKKKIGCCRLASSLSLSLDNKKKEEEGEKKAPFIEYLIYGSSLL